MQTSTVRQVLAALLVAGVLLGGVALAYSGGPFGLDDPVMAWVIAHRNAAVMPTVSVVSDCFGPMMIAIWTIAIAVGLTIYDRSIVRATAVVASVVTAGIVAEIVKLVVARPRPPLQFHRTIAETSFSYPSGHVTGTCALAVTVALVCTASTAPRVRRGVVSAAVAITLVVAGTRLYLGVHWVSDVVAAMAVGIAVALIIPPLAVGGLTDLHRRTASGSTGRLSGWLRPRSASPNGDQVHAHH
ncbi:phosphatase PAP2 family protein [Gordonia insulae]|uniref:Phosphatidic acid phosphatase type 2/haloperoxidase domain-containing protein n=1 Tax=Gordonia insulae TaxID=2420509 RepID=A0A3G8JMG8_9ACTN|nr:phosphatase PAP2 family protein [Gordonia insulae]AZG46266.1 hypothetical protein D7316_02867 [Gordonia insulae]